MWVTARPCDPSDPCSCGDPEPLQVRQEASAHLVVAEALEAVPTPAWTPGVESFVSWPFSCRKACRRKSADDAGNARVSNNLRVRCAAPHTTSGNELFFSRTPVRWRTDRSSCTGARSTYDAALKVANDLLVVYGSAEEQEKARSALTKTEPAVAATRQKPARCRVTLSRDAPRHLSNHTKCQEHRNR